MKPGGETYKKKKRENKTTFTDALADTSKLPTNRLLN